MTPADPSPSPRASTATLLYVLACALVVFGLWTVYALYRFGPAELAGTFTAILPVLLPGFAAGAVLFWVAWRTGRWGHRAV
jgi:hypothetical protein